ncbi:sialidase-3-like [Pelodytes ibericus]
MAGLDSPDLVTLFHQEPSGVTYRIPALLYIPDPPTFLAFSERRSSPSDHDALYLVMRTGELTHGSIHWGDIAALPSAKLQGHRTMNPCPVYDAASRTVFLFFICVRTNRSEIYQILTGRNASRLCCTTSVDHGKTWTRTRDLTVEIIGNDLRSCATLAVGPGHGIQVQCGRLIVPAYYYYIHSRACGLPIPCKTKPHSFVFYSDDHGRSWRRGCVLWTRKTSECQVAEVTCSGGACFLYCNARTRQHYRVEAVTNSQGLNFASSHFSKRLCEPPTGCQGSVVGFRPPDSAEMEDLGRDFVSQGLTSDKDSSSWLLYSHPTSSKKRVDLGVYLNKSPLVPSAWTQPWVINKGPSGYSDLSFCHESHSFACLFECGVNACEKICFRRFTLEEVVKNVANS